MNHHPGRPKCFRQFVYFRCLTSLRSSPSLSPSSLYCAIFSSLLHGNPLWPYSLCTLQVHRGPQACAKKDIHFYDSTNDNGHVRQLLLCFGAIQIKLNWIELITFDSMKLERLIIKANRFIHKKKLEHCHSIWAFLVEWPRYLKNVDSSRLQLLFKSNKTPPITKHKTDFRIFSSLPGLSAQQLL